MVNDPNASEKESKQDDSAVGWFYRPAGGFFVLWIVLWLMVVAKFAVVRGFAGPELAHLTGLLIAMLVFPWGAACVAWRVTGGDKLKTEITWLAVACFIFLVQTIFMYREAMDAL